MRENYGSSTRESYDTPAARENFDTSAAGKGYGSSTRQNYGSSRENYGSHNEEVFCCSGSNHEGSHAYGSGKSGSGGLRSGLDHDDNFTGSTRSAETHGSGTTYRAGSGRHGSYGSTHTGSYGSSTRSDYEDDYENAGGLSAPNKRAYGSSAGKGNTYGAGLNEHFAIDSDHEDEDINARLYGTTDATPKGDSTLGKLMQKAGEVTGIEPLVDKGTQMRRNSREAARRQDQDYDSFP